MLDGTPAKLGARAFDVLLALVERRERVVPKRELMDLVWPRLVVEENNLLVHMVALRKLLDAAGLGGEVDVSEFSRYGSARKLYNFHVENLGSY